MKSKFNDIIFWKNLDPETKTMDQLAQEAGCAKCVVCKYLKKFNLSFVKKESPTKFKKGDIPEYLKDRILKLRDISFWEKLDTANKTLGQISEEIGFAKSTIRRYLKKFNLPYDHNMGGKGSNGVKSRFQKGCTSSKKGKSLEELYGMEKAQEIRNKQSLSHIGKGNKNKSFEENYPLETIEAKKERLRQKQIEIHNTPEFKEKASKIMKEVWQREGYREKSVDSHLKWYDLNMDKWYETTFGPFRESCQSEDTNAKRAASHRTEEYKELARQKRMRQSFPTEATSIELKLREGLKNKGIIFEINKPLFNKTQPDIFIEPNIAVYADGCYFHYCNCLVEKNKFNSSMGKELSRVPNRDKKINDFLLNKGYKVLRFWEHDINKNLEECIKKVIENVKV